MLKPLLEPKKDLEMKKLVLVLVLGLCEKDCTICCFLCSAA